MHASSDAKIENQDTQRGQEVKGANRRLLTSVGTQLLLLLLLLNLNLCFIYGITVDELISLCCSRLCRAVQGKMQLTLEAKRVHKSLRDMLCEVQLCSSWNLREQRDVWEMLYWHDDSWQQDQMPLINYMCLPFQRAFSWIYKSVLR